MSHEILQDIPYQRVVTDGIYGEEIYDLYQLGIFGRDNIELVELQPESKYQQHYHKYSKAIIYIILGTGVFILKDQSIKYEAGMQIEINKGVLHGFITETKTLFLSIQNPPILDNENGLVDLHYTTNKKTL